MAINGSVWFQAQIIGSVHNIIYFLLLLLFGGNGSLQFEANYVNKINSKTNTVSK